MNGVEIYLTSSKNALRELFVTIRSRPEEISYQKNFLQAGVAVYIPSRNAPFRRSPLGLGGASLPSSLPPFLSFLSDTNSHSVATSRD
jgi:hypothetical protein